MFVWLRLIGGGSEKSGFRVNMPTFIMHQVDYEAGMALCEVPDEDVPPEIKDYIEHVLQPGGIPKPGTHLPALAKQAWVAHLNERYQEHAGRFDPECYSPEPAKSRSRY